MQASTQRQGAASNPITHFIVAPIFFVSLAAAVYLALFHRHDHPLLYPSLILLCLALFLLNPAITAVRVAPAGPHHPRTK